MPYENIYNAECLDLYFNTYIRYDVSVTSVCITSPISATSSH